VTLPDLFTIDRDARESARAVLYVATFIYGWWAHKLFGEPAERHWRRALARFRKR
jgi:hypothetical protein